MQVVCIGLHAACVGLQGGHGRVAGRGSRQALADQRNADERDPAKGVEERDLEAERGHAFESREIGVVSDE